MLDPKIARNKLQASADPTNDRKPDASPLVREIVEILAGRPDEGVERRTEKILGGTSLPKVVGEAKNQGVSPTATRLAPDYLPIDGRPFTDEEHIAQFFLRLRRLVTEGRTTPTYQALAEEPSSPPATIDRAQADGTWTADAPFSPLPEWSFLHRPDALVPEAREDMKQMELPQLGPYVRNAREPVGSNRVAREEELEYLRNYVANVSRAMREVLLPQLADGRLFRDYAESLREQHRVLARRYGGHSLGKNSYADPGVFIFDFGRRYIFPLGSHFWSIGLLENNMGYPATKVVQEHLAKSEHSLSGLPREAWPKYHMNLRGLLFEVPAPEQMPAVLARMGELLRLTFENLDRPIGLVHLADYLHIASCTHLFHRGNYSLFMAHVNVALERMGLKPIAHGYLDYAAMCMGHEDFREIFASAVAVQNA